MNQPPGRQQYQQRRPPQGQQGGWQRTQQGRPHPQENNRQLVPYQGGQQPNRADYYGPQPGVETRPADLICTRVEFTALHSHGTRMGIHPPLGPGFNMYGRQESECLHYVYAEDGCRHPNCYRACNHIPIPAGSDRHRNLTAFKQGCLQRQAARPDFQ